MKTVFNMDPLFPHKEFRVGFIGSHSVGKTRQLMKLAKLLRIPTITEGVRQVVTSLGYPSVGAVPDKILMQWQILQHQVEHEQLHVNFLSDRTTIDNAAYFERYCSRHVSYSEAEAYFRLARENAQRYTHLIYFPIAWSDPEADGFRDTDPTERVLIDEIVRDMIIRFGVEDRVYAVREDDFKDPANPSDARLVEIMQALKLYQAMRTNDLTPNPKFFHEGYNSARYGDVTQHLIRLVELKPQLAEYLPQSVKHPTTRGRLDRHTLFGL